MSLIKKFFLSKAWLTFGMRLSHGVRKLLYRSVRWLSLLEAFSTELRSPWSLQFCILQNFANFKDCKLIAFTKIVQCIARSEHGNFMKDVC